MTPLELGAVALGGGAGAVSRYAVSRAMGERYDGAFPLGITLVNVTGCFLLGCIATLLAAHSHVEVLSALLTTGFLGGYTTFSTYALEGMVLYLDGARRVALAGVVAPPTLGLCAGAAGCVLARAFLG
jgi:fluoride exporter